MAGSRRSVRPGLLALLGLVLGLLPLGILAVVTADLPPPPAPAGELAEPAAGAASRAPRPAPAGLVPSNWVHGLPLLPRRPAAPAPADEELAVPAELPDEAPGEPPAVAPATPAPARPAAAAPPRPLPPVAGPSTLGTGVPAAVRRWESLILRWAGEHGLDPNLVAALMMTESGGNPRAVSPKGAVGLMQVMGGSPDPEENVRQGTAILAGHVARYGRLDLALAAYNAGPGAVEQYGGIPPYRETRDHVFRVLLRLELYRAR